MTAFDDAQQYDLEPGTVDPREVCRYLDEAVPADVGLMLGGGSGRRWSPSLTPSEQSRRSSSEPAPTLVDVRISGNVVTIPYRRVHHRQDA